MKKSLSCISLGRSGPQYRSLLACVIAFTPSTQAQEPSGLQDMRQNFLQKLLDESTVLTEQYERALARLETELAASTDYEEAWRVQKRREELKAINASAGPSQPQGIELSVATARLSGSTEARGDLLTGWRTAGSMAEWSGIRVGSGSFFLELEACLTEQPALAGSSSSARSQPRDRVSFSFYEVSLLPGSQENRRSFDIALSRDESTFTPLRIGPLSFNHNPVTLRLLPAQGYPGNQVRLRQLRLVRQTDDVITAASAPPEGNELDQARQRLLTALQKAQAVPLKKYGQTLEEIAGVNPSLRDEAEAEQKRLGKLQAADEGKTGLNPLAKLLARTGGVAGFEDLADARFVSESATSGDRFTIEHDGERMDIHLLWVHCAPMEEEGEARQAYAKHFGIDDSDIAALARTAREFTQGYLEGKPLRLLLRPGRDKDGSRAALVFLPEVGLFQTVLVDQGLAAVHLPPKEALRGMMEKGLISTLQAHETSARRLNNGAWALGTEAKP